MIPPALTALFAGLLSAILPGAVQARATAPFVETELDPLSPYVQARVHYRLRLYRESHLQHGHFVTPRVADAILVPLDAPEPRKVERNGRPYELVEERYLLFPQRSGELRLPPPVFSSRELFVRGEPATLEVRPRPPTAPEHDWLPALEVELTEEWQMPSAPLQVGDHLRRTLTIRALGLTGGQLPLLFPLETDGAEVQRLGSETGQQIQGERIIGKRVERLLLIPLQDGDLEIPEIRLPWWSTREDTPKLARLPSGRLRIAPAPEAAAEIASPPATRVPGAPNPSDIARDLPDVDSILWSLLGLSGVGLLFFYLERRRGQSDRLRRALRLRLDTFRQRRCLAAACRRGDAWEARDALLAWGRTQWKENAPPSPLGFMRLSEDPDVREALRNLDRSLYGGSTKPRGVSTDLKPLEGLVRGRAGFRTRRSKRALPGLWDSLRGP